MDNNSQNQGFQYTYSAKEQEEIRRIREKYIKKEEDKMQYLRRLDMGVAKKAQAASLSLGILGSLIMGAGMSLLMTELGELLGIFENTAMLLGIIIGGAGVILVSLAYPTYIAVLKREKKKIAPEIIRLTDELMK